MHLSEVITIIYLFTFSAPMHHPYGDEAEIILNVK